MALLMWDSSYSVGVQSLDGQHQNLFDMLNELHAAMLAGQAREATGKLLEKLICYTRSHFAAEEQMMMATHYPGFSRHRQIHVQLTKQVDEFVDRYERGESALSIHLLTFLRDWLTKHIQHEDREYGPWMNGRGKF
jgi:hemerythrin